MRPLLLLLALLPAPALAATRTYSITTFDRIRLEGPYTVTLRVGPGASARADGDQRAIDRLKVEVQGTTLVIRTGTTGWGGWDKASPGRVSLAVTTPALSGVGLSGSGMLAIDRAKAMRFDIAVSGSGSVALEAVATDRLGVVLVGSGRVTVAGHAPQTKATLQGSGSIDATKLAVDDLELGSSGSGDAKFAATRTAKVSATGSGDVWVAGTATCTVNAVGSGEVRCGKGS